MIAPVYPDLKNEVTFRKVFGRNHRVLISFLNLLLPLKPEQQVVAAEYLNAEVLPALAVYKKYWDVVRQQKSLVVDAYDEGRAEGKVEGKLEEPNEANLEFTINLITNTDFSDEKIAALVGVDVSWVESICKKL